MARYYGPRRRAKPTPSGPPSAVEQWLGKILLGIMSLSAIVYGGLFVLGTLYVVFTKGIPAVYHAVADWGNDVATTVSEHEWQYTERFSTWASCLSWSFATPDCGRGCASGSNLGVVKQIGQNFLFGGFESPPSPSSPFLALNVLYFPFSERTPSKDSWLVRSRIMQAVGKYK